MMKAVLLSLPIAFIRVYGMRIQPLVILKKTTRFKTLIYIAYVIMHIHT